MMPAGPNLGYIMKNNTLLCEAYYFKNNIEYARSNYFYEKISYQINGDFLIKSNVFDISVGMFDMVCLFKK